MESLMNVSPGQAGLLVWVVWALIGLFEGLVAPRCFGGRRMLAADITIGIVTALLGGYISICYLGTDPVTMFLISILGSIFISALALWVTGALLFHFTKDEYEDEE